MKAVVRIGGKQYIVAEKETLLVDRLPEGTKELAPDVLMTIDGDKSTVGTPLVKGVAVKAKVDELDVKGDKIRIGKFQAKKRVKTINGHRQRYSRITIASIK